MPSAADRLGALLVGALLVGGCTAVETATPSPAGSSTPSASPTAGDTPLPPTPTPAPLVPDPGRPYDAADVLATMAESRRPGGVPDQLERPDIAAAVAAELWTYDGARWDTLVAGGSCGPATCTLEVAGAPADAVGEDLYLFSVDPGSGAVTVTAAELRGLPPLLTADLDAWARERWPGEAAPGPLASARWLPPPDAGAFVLSYRSGGEEGSPAVDAHIDVRTGEIDLRQPGG